MSDTALDIRLNTTSDTQPDTRRRVRRLGPGKRIPFTRGIGPLLLIGVWSLGSAAGRLDPRILPAPWSVVHTGWQLWQSGTLGPDLAISLQRASEGFAIGLTAGVVLALLAGLSRVGAAIIDGSSGSASARLSRSRSSPSPSTSRSTSTSRRA